MDTAWTRRGAVSLGPQLRQWFAMIHGNISAVGPRPLPPPVPPPPKPPLPAGNVHWDPAAHGQDLTVSASGVKATWPQAQCCPPGLPEPAGCNEAVRTSAPLLMRAAASQQQLQQQQQQQAALTVQLQAGRALTDHPFKASVGVCTGASQNFSNVGHFHSLLSNESWVYSATGTLVNATATVAVTPWSQPAKGVGSNGDVPSANISVQLVAATPAEGSEAKADFFLNGVFVGSLAVPSGVPLFGCAASCANGTALAMRAAPEPTVNMGVRASAVESPNRLKTDEAAATTQRRGLRWAVSHPSPAAPFLLGPNAAGWANTTRSVAAATVGILVQPTVFGINSSGMLTCEFPDLIKNKSLLPYAERNIETIVSLFPWTGGLHKGDYAASGGYRGPPNQGLNCTTSVAKNRTDPRSRYCVTPDMIVRAALARKEAFALELGQLLKHAHASGFSLDWEYFYGNNQTNAAALWHAVKQEINTTMYPWITNGLGIDWSDCGPIHRCGRDFAYCWDYKPLIPVADGLLNMGSYSPLNLGFGPGKYGGIEPVACGNKSAGIVITSGKPKGRWCGLGGTVKDLLTHGARKSQLSPGIWMDACVNGTTTMQGWTQPILKSFLDYAALQGASTVTIWSGLTATPKWITANTTNNVTHKITKDWPNGWLEPWSTVYPSKLETCPWFVPTLLDWVEQGRAG